MLRRCLTVAGTLAVLLLAVAAVTIPALAGDHPAAPVPPPSAPQQESDGEDTAELPRTAAERERAMRYLRRVARCVRARGVEVPEPVNDEHGVRLGWEGPPRPLVEAAIRHCDGLL